MTSPTLFAQNQGPNVAEWLQANWPLLLIVVLALFLIIAAIIFISFLRLRIRSWLTGARIGILDLVGMKLRNVDYNMIVNQKIALVQAGVKVSTQELEAHYLALGLANWVCTLSPRRIVLGGGVMQQAQLFPLIRKELLALLNGYVQAREITDCIDQYVVPARLGGQAGVLGGLVLAEEAAGANAA